jgi:hypothetical protein
MQKRYLLKLPGIREGEWKREVEGAKCDIFYTL